MVFESSVIGKREYFASLIKFYNNQGLCWLPAKYGEKGTSTLKWKEFQIDLPSEELKAKFASEMLDDLNCLSNVCIMLGWGDLIVFDLESPELLSKAFPKSDISKATFVVKTGKGFHVYFKCKDEKLRPINNQALKFEVRCGKGQLVTAPPSKHPSGNFYEVVNPNFVSVGVQSISFDEVAMVCKNLGHEFRVDSIKLNKTLYTSYLPRLIKVKIVNGNRNHACMALSGILKNMGRSLEDARVWMAEWYTFQNQEGFSFEEVESCMNSAFKGDYNYNIHSLKKFSEYDSIEFKPEDYVISCVERVDNYIHQEFYRVKFSHINDPVDISYRCLCSPIELSGKLTGLFGFSVFLGGKRNKGNEGEPSLIKFVSDFLLKSVKIETNTNEVDLLEEQVLDFLKNIPVTEKDEMLSINLNYALRDNSSRVLLISQNVVCEYFRKKLDIKSTQRIYEVVEKFLKNEKRKQKRVKNRSGGSGKPIWFYVFDNVLVDNDNRAVEDLEEQEREEEIVAKQN